MDRVGSDTIRNNLESHPKRLAGRYYLDLALYKYPRSSQRITNVGLIIRPHRSSHLDYICDETMKRNISVLMVEEVCIQDHWCLAQYYKSGKFLGYCYAWVKSMHKVTSLYFYLFSACARCLLFLYPTFTSTTSHLFIIEIVTIGQSSLIDPTTQSGK